MTGILTPSFHASSIHPEVEDLLNKTVGNYIKQKEHQKMKLITSDCETSLRQENEELCISKQVLKKKIEELLDLQEQYKSRENWKYIPALMKGNYG
ncbi:hypothetical protein C1645_831757 [Glomus cerebriforme]|uniref:Uncharacterized protein n=1 Tax=Glomus cerebriforme TaxID=658196 RepID=A0A397SEW9_9GLOM|nr:hypothetical protein C1645_831757 [Glomus cerebriforme]